MAKKFPGKITYSRIMKLDQLLRSGRLPPLPEFAQKFGVSKRTVERDIECLRDYFGAPLAYDRIGKIYRYTDKNYRLPAIALTQEELVSVLVTERLLRQYAGTPFEPLIRQTFSKLVAMLPGEACISVDVTNLRKAMVFEQGIPVREYSLSIFTVLLGAIIRSRRIEIVYYTLQGNKEEGTRFVDPYHIANLGGEWYLIAFCQRKHDICHYHMGRIREAYPLDILFKCPQDFNPQKYITSAIVNTKDKNSEKIRFKIFPSASRWAKEKVWHFTQKFEKLDDDGAMIFTMESPRDKAGRESLGRWVLQFGEEAEVLEPAWLRKEIKEKLEKTGQRYRE